MPKGSVSVLHYSSGLANTVGGKVNLGAMDQHYFAPPLALSLPEAKSEILALSRDS